MSLSIKTIFLRENEKNIFQSLKKEGIDAKVFESKLADLFNRVYNNFVGYYIFRQDCIVYKLIVLPKTINKENEDAEKDFVNYLLHYHRVNSKHKFDETRQIDDSLLSLAFEENNKEEKENSHFPLDEFEFYKYKSIIERIEKFFKKHKNYKKVNIDYKSQGIKYKLNLSRNIKELDKTKIHQIQSFDMMYSMIATITYNSLKMFISKRVKNIDAKYKKQLIQDTKRVINFISRKYTIDKNYKLTFSELNNYKTTKVFSKKNDTKQLLVDIKSLFGFEQMYTDKDLIVNNRYDLTSTSFFINPILFYEWYVYDILKVFSDAKGYRILFDKLKDENKKTTIKYNLISKEYGKEKNRSSNPDYIIVDEEKKIKIVLDAKWKNIQSLGKIDSSDFLKLQYDGILSETNKYKSIPYLIYPKYLCNEDSISISKDENQYFNFSILQIDMNFVKEKNSIDFKYDFEQQEEQIKKEKEEKEAQKLSEDFTSKIYDKRKELLTKFFNSEGLEEKEEVFSELDTQLIESSNNLSSQLEGEKLPSEIEKILKIYDKTLDEESKTFLKSSGLIYQYYKNRNCEYFDYSMPGSGFWKLVELELNSSLIWYIRIKNNVCSNSCAWTPTIPKYQKVAFDYKKNKFVNINKHSLKIDNRLTGLMLGEIKNLISIEELLNDTKKYQIFDNNIFIRERLEELLEQVISIRNEHAHIKAMSLDKFEELYKLLFKEEKNIEKLLDMKNDIISSI